MRLIRQAAQEAARLESAKLPQIVAAVRRFVQLLEGDLERCFTKGMCVTFYDRFILDSYEMKSCDSLFSITEVNMRTFLTVSFHVHSPSLPMAHHIRSDH